MIVVAMPLQPNDANEMIWLTNRCDHQDEVCELCIDQVGPPLRGC